MNVVKAAKNVGAELYIPLQLRVGLNRITGGFSGSPSKKDVNLLYAGNLQLATLYVYLGGLSGSAD